MCIVCQVYHRIQKAVETHGIFFPAFANFAWYWILRSRAQPCYTLFCSKVYTVLLVINSHMQYILLQTNLDFTPNAQSSFRLSHTALIKPWNLTSLNRKKGCLCILSLNASLTQSKQWTRWSNVFSVERMLLLAQYMWFRVGLISIKRSAVPVVFFSVANFWQQLWK